jgi:hypothetical protein
MYKYSKYNREERNLCAHLFRLLLTDYPNCEPLKEFVGDFTLTYPRIFSEAALIRDAYFVRKPYVNDFLDQICKIIAEQEEISGDYRLYSELPTVLNDPTKTHPKQIHAKADKENIELSQSESVLYGCFQGMFNAKPDLVVCYNDNLLIYEAKFTMKFDKEQLSRTEKIGEIWQRLLYEDLEFDAMPKTQVLTLGLDKYKPDVSWTNILSIALNYLKDGDPSLDAFRYAALTKT